MPPFLTNSSSRELMMRGLEMTVGLFAISGCERRNAESTACAFWSSCGGRLAA